MVADPGSGYATAKLVASIIGGTAATVQAVGQYQQAKAQSKILEYNAKVAEQDAIATKQQAEYEAERLRKEKERVLSRQRALYGKAGVRLEGSPLLIMEDTAGEFEMDILNTLRTGQIQSSRYQSQAAISRAEAGITKRAGAYSTGTTLLTGAGDIAKTAYRPTIKIEGGGYYTPTKTS